MKVEMNPPLEFDVTEATVEPSKVITTEEIGANPLPVTVTEVAGNTVPEVGLIEIVGLDELPDVEKSHSQLSSTPFESKQSKKLPSSSWMLDDIDAM
jgi:hypothetical protein